MSSQKSFHKSRFFDGQVIENQVYWGGVQISQVDEFPSFKSMGQA